MTTEVFIETLLSIVFIGIIENLFLVGYIAIKIKQRILSEKFLLIIVLSATLNIAIMDKIEIFILALAVKMILIIGLICIVYGDIELKPKNLVMYFMQAFAYMTIIETTIYLPLSQFMGIDIAMIRENIINTIVLSIPTRVVEMSFLYIYYLKQSKREEYDVKEID